MTRASRTAVLLVACKDRTGLVSAISEFITRNGGNILHADQHADAGRGIFLQRVEWDLAGFALDRDRIAEDFRPIAKRLEMKWSLHFSDRVPRMAVFVSRQAHCMYDLLARWKLGEFRAEVAVIVSNHDDLRGLAEPFGVDYLLFPITPQSRASQEEKILRELDRHGVDLVVLARYMQILGPEFVGRYPDRIINIHHSFLPAFSGARPYHKAHARGVKVIGATAHYVTEELDQGPVIEQDVIRISHRDSVGDLMRKGRDLEKVVLARAVDLHLRRRVMVYGNKTVVFD